MKLLVIGSGGREACAGLAAGEVAAHPEGLCRARQRRHGARERNWRTLPITSIDDLVAFAEREQIYLTVVGPEAPLAAGVVDAFRAKNLRIFGPTREAAQLESSKDFAKRFMQRHKIPTAPSPPSATPRKRTPTSMPQGAPIVIKADGLAAGKGVVVAMDSAEAHAAIDMMLTDNRMGDAGARVVIEEFLEGEEASFIVMCDGAARPAARHQPGPQAPQGRRRGAQHRRHGRLFAGAGGDASRARPRHARGHHADAQRHGCRTAFPTPASSTPA
jgi:phosphoribosylamine--glycine ligase